MCEKGYKGDSRWVLGGIAGLFAVLVSVSGVFAEVTVGLSSGSEEFPYFYGNFDDAGYSDAIYYGPSPEHPVGGNHELLSGEWGSAIFYNGVESQRIDPDFADRRAMWLTKKFLFPYWNTGNTLEATQTGAGASWDDPDNPACTGGVPDTGQSMIANDDLEIQIDYEVVDLQYLDPNFYDPNEYLSRSPLGFLEQDADDPNEPGVTADPNMFRSAYVYSDRYIFLQTYTIRNVTETTLAGLAFYQFLHSHGADEYGSYLSSTYNPMNYMDALADYVPYDPIHRVQDSNTVGNFRYDITQWNHWPDRYTAGHKDWVGFSCAIKPDWIDNDVYRGGHASGLYKPRAGTHIHIENRNLNDADHILLDEVGGALGWSLGALEPDETVKLTVAFMFIYGGQTPVRHGLYVRQTDDLADCYDRDDPNATITYTISYGNSDPNAVTETDVVLIDYLPEEIDRMSVQASGAGSYDIFTNTVTWDIGTLNVDDSGQESVTVKIVLAGYGSTPVNKAVLKNDTDMAEYFLKTTVCEAPASGTIYVDKFASGLNDGTNWYDAFGDLQDALEKAETLDSVEIYVANGTYFPGVQDADSFVIPDDVELYGGFAGYTYPTETKEARNFKRNKTILSGFVLAFPDDEGGEIVYRNNTVVTMGDNSLLDGFTVREAGLRGIDGSDVSSTIANCVVEKNEERGIFCQDGNLTVRWCEIKDNGYYGIRQEGVHYSLTIDNCIIYNNQRDGIYIDQSTSKIKNSVIYSNGSDGNYYGINLLNPSSNSIIHNNTVVHNTNESINFTGDYLPDVRNCILWGNNDDQSQLAGLGIDQIYYSCIPDCNDVNPQHNINDYPAFAYSDPPYGYYHLSADSPCVDAGDNTYVDPNGTGEYDIDGDDRIFADYVVDIGADEVACEDTWHEIDWTYDGVINMEEFAIFSAAWLSHDPNDPSLPPGPKDPNDEYIWYEKGWGPLADINDDYVVGLDDFVLFCNNWLWTACWRENYVAMYGMSGGGESMTIAAPPLMSTLAAYKTQPVPEKSISERILDLENCIELLEEIWLEDPYIQQKIDSGDWNRFMDAVYDGLDELKTASSRK